MAFWEAATKTLPLGLQISERAKDREERKQARKEDTAFREKQFGLQEDRLQMEKDRAARDKEAYEAEQIAKKFGPQLQIIMDEYNQNPDDIRAAFRLNELYKKIPNGDEARIIPNVQSHPEIVQGSVENGAMPPEYAGANILAISKKYGMRPYQSMKEVLFDAASDLGMTNVVNMVRQRNQALADKQAEAMKPENLIRTKDGVYYQEWGISGDGTIKALGYKPYTGPAETEEQKVARVTGLPVGSKEFQEAYRKKVFGLPTENELASQGRKTEKENLQIEKERLQIQKLKKDLQGNTNFTTSQISTLIKQGQDAYDIQYPKDQMTGARPKDSPDLYDFIKKDLPKRKALITEGQGQGKAGSGLPKSALYLTTKEIEGKPKEGSQPPENDPLNVRKNVPSPKKGIHLTAEGEVKKKPAHKGVSVTVEGSVNKGPSKPMTEREKQAIRKKIPSRAGIRPDEAVMALQEPGGYQKFIDKIKMKHGNDPKQWPFIVKKMFYDLAQNYPELEDALVATGG